jgi:GH35 family endo-1,4-beta-xylanase
MQAAKIYTGLTVHSVQNEMISDTPDNGTFKDNIWTQKLGQDAVAKALRIARTADPRVKLLCVNRIAANGYADVSLVGLQHQRVWRRGIEC